MAHDAFVRANEAIKSPQADFWIAKSLDQMSKTEDAIAAYEAFLANPDAAKAGDQKVSEAQARLSALKATLVAEVSVETDPMLASVAVDGAPQPGEAPMTLKLTPGKHRVTVSSTGYVSKDTDLEVKGGDKLKQSIVLVKEVPVVAAVVPVAAAAPPPPPPPPLEEHSKGAGLRDARHRRCRGRRRDDFRREGPELEERFRQDAHHQVGRRHGAQRAHRGHGVRRRDHARRDGRRALDERRHAGGDPDERPQSTPPHRADAFSAHAVRGGEERRRPTPSSRSERALLVTRGTLARQRALA